MSSDLDQDIKALLAGLDAPAADESFVGGVMRRATSRVERVPALQFWAVRLAALLALVGVIPFLADGLGAVLQSIDVSLAAATLALSLTGWSVFSVMTRAFRPSQVNMTKFSPREAHL